MRARAALGLALALAGCSGDDGATGASATSGTTDGTTTGADTTGEGSGSTGSTGGIEPMSGELHVLSYNVAGLPQGISGSNPEVNTPLISPLLNAYDLVLVQEDFYYHEALIAAATHPYKSERSGDGVNDLGDGLNRLTAYAFGPLTRTAWEACNGQFNMGSDCLAKKGFSVAEHELAPGVTIDVYNLHMDAGRGELDVAARVAQAEQLGAVIAARSAGRAIVVAGDTNMKEEDEATLQALMTAAGLTDACRALACGDELRIDRVLYRSSDAITLEATSWALDPAFVDADGVDLSDHEALAVVIAWST